MPSLAFYWRGSSAANINSLSWDTQTNWRIRTYSATAGSIYSAAPRLPMGGDNVYFGTNYLEGITQASSNTILSPCLFGGITTATSSWWSGATAGSSLSEKHGGIYVTVYPCYPFSKLGGKIDEQILEEWTRNLQVNYWLGSSAIATGPNQWTLASGTEYVDAAYVSTWYGATVGISYGNQPSYAIRHRGGWRDTSKYGTMTSIFGVTGNTAGAGGTGYNYDGTTNRVYIESDPVPSFGYFSNVSTLFGPFGYSHAVQTVAGEVYRHGGIEVSGHYNSISSISCTRDAKVILTNAKINAVKFDPSQAVVSGTTGYSMYLSNSGITMSWFDVGGFYMDQNSTARAIVMGRIDQINGEIVVHGDVTASGGFPCVYPEGASAGVSGGVLIPNGSISFQAPLRDGTEPAIVTLGYPSSEGTKQSTAVNNFYAQPGTIPVVYSLAGNYQGTNFWLNAGTLQFGPALPARATVEIGNLSLAGNSTLDLTPASPQFNGTANLTIVPQSNAATIKPGTGNQFSTTMLFG